MLHKCSYSMLIYATKWHAIIGFKSEVFYEEYKMLSTKAIEDIHKTLNTRVINNSITLSVKCLLFVCF